MTCIANNDDLYFFEFENRQFVFQAYIFYTF